MTKDVLIHIKGLQMLEGVSEQEEPVEVLTTGEYYYRNHAHYLIYEEIVEENQETVKNRVKFRPGFMEVRKKGAVEVQMIFEENKKNLAFYKTPFGTIEMEIVATRVNVNEQDEYLQIDADYALGMNGSSVADCSIEIRVTPKGEKKGAVFFQ